MAACDMLYHDRTHASSGDGWRPCTAPGQVWTDPELALRFVCTTHRRQLVALWATGLADRIRWARGCQPLSGAAGAREPAGRDLARLPGPSGPLPGADRLADRPTRRLTRERGVPGGATPRRYWPADRPGTGGAGGAVMPRGQAR